MTFAASPQLPIPATWRVADLPRRAQFLLLTLRLAHELPIEDRNFQGFLYALCGISRVEQALGAVGDILACLAQAPRRPAIASTVDDDIAEDERRLLELAGSRWDFGLAMAGRLVPQPADAALLRAVNRLAATLD